MTWNRVRSVDPWSLTRKEGREMLVKYWMRKDVITVNVNDSLNTAMTLMREHRPPFLPVLNDGGLVGELTDLDLARASALEAGPSEMQAVNRRTSQIKCGDVMNRDVIAVPLDHTLEETAALLLVLDRSAALVVDDAGYLQGVISLREICLSFILMTGFGRMGLQLACEIEDKQGEIKRITDIIGSYGGRMVSLLTSCGRALPGTRRVYVRTCAVDPEKMPQMLRDLKLKCKLLYLVDHSKDKREEYIESGCAA